MEILIHPHAQDRMAERGVLNDEIIETVQSGESFDAKYNRTGFRKNFNYEAEWRGKFYHVKQVEVYAEKEFLHWLVITVISKYY